ncbi:MAG: SRPBCC family protein [Arenicellales bacterium]
MSNSTLVKTYIFATSRETVWSFLTKKDKLAQWFHPATADLVEGEDYALVRVDDDGTQIKQCWGTVLQMDKPNSLVYTFTIEPLNGSLTTVTWRLEEVQGGTKLILQHDGIEEAAGEASISLLLALDKGWDKHADQLRNLIIPSVNSECDH